jgi:protein-S-isoprenylcysteine O-methyltransferase Ste14
MDQGKVVSLLHTLSGVGTMIVSIVFKEAFLKDLDSMKVVGYVIFLTGMSLFVLCVLALRKAFLGEVEPVTDTLVVSGPYRIIRHPLYLSMTVSIFGIAFGVRSLWGLLATFIVFIPICILRAKLEEAHLARRFTRDWEAYTRKTYFMFPPFY